MTITHGSYAATLTPLAGTAAALIRFAEHGRWLGDIIAAATDADVYARDTLDRLWEEAQWPPERQHAQDLAYACHELAEAQTHAEEGLDLLRQVDPITAGQVQEDNFARMRAAVEAARTAAAEAVAVPAAHASETTAAAADRARAAIAALLGDDPVAAEQARVDVLFTWIEETPEFAHHTAEAMHEGGDDVGARPARQQAADHVDPPEAPDARGVPPPPHSGDTPVRSTDRHPGTAASAALRLPDRGPTVHRAGSATRPTPPVPQRGGTPTQEPVHRPPSRR